MILEFLQPFGSWKVGQITDDISETVGRSLVDQGTAKQSTEAAQLRALMLAETERTRTEMLELTRTSLQELKPTSKGPPNGGGAVEFERISNGEPVYEKKEERYFSDVLRCIHAVTARGAPREIVDYASNRLRHVYSEEKIEYKVDPESGKVNSVVTRNLPGGGTEVITRTGTDSLGGGATYGFTIKPNYLGDLFQIAREREVFANGCRNVPVVQGIETKYPALGQYSAPTIGADGVPQAAVFAGITLAYKNETAARVESDANVEEIDFKIVDMTGATSYSRDYIVDNFIAMDAIVTGLFGQAMAWEEDWVCIRGDGLGKPQGYFNCNAAIIGGPNSNARSNATNISSEDLGWMLSHVVEGNPRWIAHRSTIPKLYILNNAAGTPVFQPNASIVQSDQPSLYANQTNTGGVRSMSGMLLGLPIYFTEKVPQLGTVGDISLVCPSEYGLAQKAGIEIGVSEHFYFSTDKIAYRFKKRHDGRSLWRAPYIDASNLSTPASGWQISPFVMLK